MSPRSTLILALVAVALAAFVYFYEILGADERAKAADAEKRVFPAVQEASEIEAFELVTGAGPVVRVERESTDSERWRVVSPVAFPADELNADAIAAALAELTAERVFEEHEPLEAYGLTGEPRIRFEAGEAEYALRVGDAAPVGGSTYVADRDGTRVFAVQTFRTNAFDRSLDDLRDKRVTEFDRGAVSHVEVAWPGGAVVLERGEDGWRMTSPVESAADADTVEGLLSDLEFLRADGFVDEEPAPEAGDLDDPWLRAVIRAGEGEPVEVVVGAEREGAKRLVSGLAGPRYLVPAARLEGLPRSVVAFRDRQVARFSSGDARQLNLEFRSEEGEVTALTVSRDDGGWSAAPEPMAPGKASRLVSELSDLEAEDIAADAMGEAERAALGLAPPRVSITVAGQAEEGEPPVLAKLLLGALDAERGIPAQREGDPVVFWLDRALAEHVPLGLTVYRERFAAREDTPELEATEPGADEELPDDPVAPD